jgi:hypothetical protein
MMDPYLTDTTLSLNVTLSLSLALTLTQCLTLQGPEESDAYRRALYTAGSIGREVLPIRIHAHCSLRKVQQWGFDETTIDGHEIINQWAMLVDVRVGDQIAEGGTTVVTLECAGVLPCSLAENVVGHIETVWERARLLASTFPPTFFPQDVLP